MPKIVEIIDLPNGKVGVALDMPTEDEGSVTLWTEAEKRREIQLAVDAAVEEEREACATIAEAGTPEQDWHPTSIMGQHGKKIAALIRDRSNS